MVSRIYFLTLSRSGQAKEARRPMAHRIANRGPAPFGRRGGSGIRQVRGHSFGSRPRPAWERSDREGSPMSVTQDEKAARFRALHDGPGTFLLPNPWDVGSACLLAGLGFQALATSS